MSITLTPPVHTGYTVTPVTLLHDDGADITDMEAVDAVVLSDRVEQIDIGGGGILGSGYLRVTGPDLVATFQALKALCDDAIEALDDARAERRARLRRPCWCGDLVDPDEVDCGAGPCRDISRLDWKGLVP